MNPLFPFLVRLTALKPNSLQCARAGQNRTDSAKFRQNWQGQIHLLFSLLFLICRGPSPNGSLAIGSRRGPHTRWRMPHLWMTAIIGRKVRPLRVSLYSTLSGNT